jgi:hypothetical protein
LGATDGPWVVSTWTPPSPLPRLLPWLGLLCLLLLKPNRAGSALWILAPLAAILAARWVLRTVFTGFLDDLLEVLLDASGALSFGLAAGWLVAANLQWKPRFAAFAGFLGVVVPVSLVVFLLGQGFEFAGLDMVQSVLLVLISGGVLAVALSLTGWLARGRYSPGGLCLWLAVVLGILWALIFIPFLVMAKLSGAESVFGPMLMAWLVMVAFSLVNLLPFLLLTFWCGYYRERIKGFLHLGERPAAAASGATAPVSL